MDDPEIVFKKIRQYIRDVWKDSDHYKFYVRVFELFEDDMS